MTTAQLQQIWHGDSIDLVQRFNDSSINCIITDPPFGVDNQSNMAVTQAGKKYARKIANDESPEVAVKVFKDVMNNLLPKTTDDCDMYVFTSYQVLSDWMSMTDEFMPQHGFKRKAVLIWEKDGPGMGDLECPWGMGMEFILFFQKGRRPKSAQRRNAVIRGPQVRPGDLIHPHEKPQWLLEMLLKTSTNEGESVVDPFGGSGSLAVAARTLNRPAVCIEYDENNWRLATERFNSREEGLF